MVFKKSWIPAFAGMTDLSNALFGIVSQKAKFK
jgi:hypothetical protein